jgi:CubicO group peptidase (beta-lactamase class C family)
MTPRYSRRRTMQAALATVAVAALPGARAAARQAAPSAGDTAITVSQVEAAVDRLDELAEDALARTGVPGAAVAVVYDDEVIYARGFGVRELGRPEPVTPETGFQLASLSKPISSTLVAAVVGDGTTTWDATIAELDAGFQLADPFVSAQITLRDMFCHHSGLPAYAGDVLIDAFHYGREECMRRLRAVPLTSPLRTAFAYTNLGLSAAAYAAARAAGESWEELAAARLFRPLGMTSASFRYGDFLSQANRAAPHYRTRDGDWDLGEDVDDEAAAPAVGASANVRDLAAWLRLHLAGGTFERQQLVARAPLLETRRPQVVAASPPDPAAGAASFYGLGWFTQYDNRGRLHVHHGGDFTTDFATAAHLLPAARLGIVVLCNA